MQPPALAPATPLAAAAQVADAMHAEHVFDEYRNRRAAQTLRAHASDLQDFATFLAAAAGHNVAPEDLATRPAAWANVSAGLVAAFREWLLGAGYALTTVNRRLATVRKYADLAADAGAIPGETAQRVAGVAGYGRKDGRKRDEKRAALGLATRRGHKKVAPVRLTAAQAAQLKQQPDTPQGRRDALLMALLLDHGLRDGEICGLTVDCFDVAAGVMRFYRPKVSLEQMHRLSRDTRAALDAWIVAGDCPASGPLLRASRKSGQLGAAGLSVGGVARRVRTLGERVGVMGLSPHDCRHYWATKWAGRVSAMRLQEAGGWASMATVRRYVERAAIANEGMDGD